MQVRERLQGVQARRFPRRARVAATAAEAAGAAGLLGPGGRQLCPAGAGGIRAGAGVSGRTRSMVRSGLGCLRGGGHLVLPSRRRLLGSRILQITLL
uniref:Uncharacterized protein n=1 Tax=Neovison vison TaxID=452646 RepID=A0A8C7A1E3_NEOVI